MENTAGPAGLVGMRVMQMQQIQIQVVGGVVNSRVYSPGLPDLLDAKGNKYQAVSIPARRMSVAGGTAIQEMTIVYRGDAGHGDPDRLVVTGSRQVNVTIPFVFRDVPVE
jgi:hypothetical protein